MFFKKARQKKMERNKEKEIEIKVIQVTIDDIRKAVNDYASTLQKGISLRSIIRDNHEIDYELLHTYLGGKPDKSFYMSKETYEIFEEPDYPKYLDMCQLACDQYLLEMDDEPITSGDPYRKINYFKLQNYLGEKPPFELYLHPDDRMVTHRPPKDK